jgi:chromosome segregation ATPase
MTDTEKFEQFKQEQEKFEQELAESEKALRLEKETVVSLRTKLASAKEDHEKKQSRLMDDWDSQVEALEATLYARQGQLEEVQSRIKIQGGIHAADRDALTRSKSKVMKENTGLRAQNSRLNAAVIRQALELTDEKEAGEHRAAELQTLHRDHEELLGRVNGSPDRD